MLTQSKGAYLAGAGGLMMLYLFKRPIWFQLVVLIVGYGVGLAALKSLPRMNTLSKNDEGIQGRMIVWQQAKASMEATTYGVGLKGFQGFVPIRVAILHRTWYMPIATHGSYVRHGADLGYVGLMLFAGVFYGGARILITAQTAAHSEARRAQRTIYAILVTIAFSCWVVDRAYQMDYFLLSGLLSAFHRRFLPLSTSGENAEDEENKSQHDNAPLQLPAPASDSSTEREVGWAIQTGNSSNGGRDDEKDADAMEADSEHANHGAISLKWNRIGVVDLLIMYGLLEAVLYFWELLSTDFVAF